MATTRVRRFTATDEQRRTVETMTAYGISQEEMSRILNIDEKTLRKHFRSELDGGQAKANAKVAESLFRNATQKNNVVAQIFWLKTRARWREQHNEVDENKAGPIGGITVTIQNPDVKKS